MKISIITVCLNSENTIISTLNSVLSQSYQDIEHIIVDGGSKDKTLKIIEKYNHKQKKIISATNSGIYDSMNKGIEASSGDIITILNSDDIYQNKSTISEIVDKIRQNPNYPIYLGDVVYFKNSSYFEIYRYYSSKNFYKWQMKIGLMPPHPSSFIRKSTYDEYGLYRSDFKIASDFEIFLRFIFKEKLSFYKLNKTVVRMRMGGISGRNLKSYIISSKEILKSFKLNSIPTNLFLVLLRLPPKLFQYIFISKKKLNLNFKLFELKFGKEYLEDAFKIVKNAKSIPFNKNFILSGLNLAFLGYYFKGDIKQHQDLYHWPDGLFAKTVFDNISKVPGRDIIKYMELPKNIQKIYIYGNLTDKNKKYLKQKFNLPIIHIQLPYGNIDKIKKYITEGLSENSLVFLTIPTPKQEQVAFEIAKKNKYFKIICIGASISIASGEEKSVPKVIENFEFLWRLRTDPLRRISRMFESMVFFLNGKYLKKKLKKINIYSIE